MRSRRSLRNAGLIAGLMGLALAGVAPFARAGTVVERTMAFINKRPLLLSEVHLTKALLGLDDAVALDRTIDETLMFEEASRLLSAPPEEKDIESAVATLREKAGPGFEGPALKRKAQTQLSIAAYIELRLRPQVRVEDAEIRKVFTERVANDPRSPAFDDAAAAIRESLEGQALDRKIEEWVASLRLRAEIRRPAARP